MSTFIIELRSDDWLKKENSWSALRSLNYGGDMRLYLLIAVALISAPATAQIDLQQSYIEANVPALESFDGLLARDLLAYFKSSGIPTVTVVKFKLLRNGPTQSGASYPKYYLWAKVFRGAKLLQEGAVRVAAIERTHFEVTDYISKVQIQAAPDVVGSVFPAALVPSVLSFALTRQPSAHHSPQ